MALKNNLTVQQKIHNYNLEQDMRDAEHEYQMRELEAKRKNLWFRDTYPDAPDSVKQTYGINVIGRRKIIGIKYVE